MLSVLCSGGENVGDTVRWYEEVVVDQGEGLGARVRGDGGGESRVWEVF